MKRIVALLLVSCGLAAAAAPWKNESLRIRVNLPGTWKPITPKMAQQRVKEAADKDDSAFYAELNQRLRTGAFFMFELTPRSPVRADLQSTSMGKPLRVLNDQDYRNLCYLWAKNHDENERPFADCQPRKLGAVWAAELFYQGDPDGQHAEHQIKYYREDGNLILFTVAGTFEQAEAIFKNTVFY